MIKWVTALWCLVIAALYAFGVFEVEGVFDAAYPWVVAAIFACMWESK